MQEAVNAMRQPELKWTHFTRQSLGANGFFVFARGLFRTESRLFSQRIKAYLFEGLTKDIYKLILCLQELVKFLKIGQNTSYLDGNQWLIQKALKRTVQ